MIDQKTVKHLATLSKIGLNENEIPVFQKKFHNIMRVIDKITAINTDGIHPMHNPLDAQAPFRTDEVTEKNQREALMQNAPNSENGLFKVPKVIG